MVIEKIKENKFKILLSLKDLEEENINIHSFMASNMENQEILKKILIKLKTDYNFFIDCKNLLVDTFYVCNRDFIMIISSLENETENIPRVTVSRSSYKDIDTFNVYKFGSKDELKVFFNFIASTSNLYYNTLLNCPLYFYNGIYFLILSQNGISEIIYTSIDKYLSEFTFKVNKPNNFYIKLAEYGDKINLETLFI